MRTGIGIVASSRFNSVVSVPATYKSLALTYSPSALWQLDDDPAGSPTEAADSTANAVDLHYGQSPPPTLHSTSIVTTGQFSASVSDRLWTPNVLWDLSTLTTGWSLSFWISATSSGENALCALGNDFQYNTSNHYGTVAFIDSANKVEFWVYNGSVIRVTGGTALSAGRHFICVVVDIANNELRLYVDGSSDGSTSLGGLPPETFLAYLHLAYCANSDPDSRGSNLPNFGIFIGSLQFAGAHPVPLTAAQVTALWNMGH